MTPERLLPASRLPVDAAARSSRLERVAAGVAKAIKDAGSRVRVKFLDYDWNLNGK